jgi:alpha-tubulin suppressor-like RCC1 family protein
LPYLKNHNAARPVFGSSKYKQVSTGYNHTCAITEDGKLDCWGLSGGGLLGDGSNSVNYFPVGNAESRTFKKVATGTTMSCAQTIENELYCWGMNDRRQLGAGLNVEYVTTPVKVDTALVFTDFVVGAQHACGLVSSGDVYCWGANNYGQLGLGDLTDRPTPVKVAALSDVKKLYAGLKVTCATSGTEVRLYCWGSNGGQMLVPASAATVNVTSPTVIVGPLSLSNQHIHDVAIYADHICYVVARWTDATKTAYMSGSPLSYCRGANGFAQINSSNTSPLKKLTNQFKFVAKQGFKAYLNKLKFSGYNPPISTSLSPLLKGKVNFEDYIKITRESTITLGISRMIKPALLIRRRSLVHE